MKHNIEIIIQLFTFTRRLFVQISMNYNKLTIMIRTVNTKLKNTEEQQSAKSEQWTFRLSYFYLR